METCQYHLNSKMPMFLLCCLLPNHFIAPVLSKVFERLKSVLFGRLMERSGVLSTAQFAYRKGLVTYEALVSMSHTRQSALTVLKKSSDLDIFGEQ